MKWAIKIANKKVDNEGYIWYKLHIRGVNPRLLGLELRNLLGKNRILKILDAEEYGRGETNTITVVVDPRA
jgi:hypothetical protein